MGKLIAGLLAAVALMAQYIPPQGGGGGGATIPNTTNLIKGSGTGNGANSKVAVTSPATAATIAFAADNETVTLPNGSVAPLVSPGFSGTPTAPTQSQGDASTKLATTSYVDTAITSSGTVLAYTADHPLAAGDCKNWLTFNGTNLTLTLSNPPISSTCQFATQNLGSTTLTVNRNGLTINGAAANYTIAAASGVSAGAVSIWTDGTNWFVSGGPPGANGTNGSNGGTGITVYSGLAGVSMSNATLFFPIGGGGLASTTEASVQSHLQSATTLSNYGVDLSAALGTTVATNNTAVFTWRKAGSDQTLTCTITNPATSCADTAHTFTTSANDLIDVKVVFTGTIAVTPNFVMNVQMGTATGGATYTPPYIVFNGSNYGPVFATTPPSASGWSWTNQGTSTVVAANNSLEFSMQTNSGTDNLRCYTRSLPASTGYTAIMGILSLSHAVGVAIGDGTKFISLWQNGSGTITGFKWNSATSTNGNYFTDISNLGVLGSSLWIRFQDAGGNRTTAISADGGGPNGTNWTPLDSQASGTFLTETVFGICQETNVGGSFKQPSVIFDLRLTTP